MSTQTPARRPAGSPAGGQFAPTSHAETDLDLAGTLPVRATATSARVLTRRTAFERANQMLDEAHWELQKAELAQMTLHAPAGATHIRVVTDVDNVDDEGGYARQADAWVDANGEEIEYVQDWERVSWSSRRDSVGQGFFELVDDSHPDAGDDEHYVSVDAARAHLDRELAEGS